MPFSQNFALENKEEWTKFIQKVLNQHFPSPKITLDHTSPYTLLIATLLSAQCTDKRVNLVTPHLFSMAETPEQMMHLPVEIIEDCIRPCGLAPTKAKAIAALSKQLVTLHEGKVPNSFEALEALPGVGHKTASVVMVQAFHIPSFPVDTHIHRLAKRWHLSTGKNVAQTEKDLKSLFPKKRWGVIHLQMIYFGRTFCPAKNHIPNQCPICSFALLCDKS